MRWILRIIFGLVALVALAVAVLFMLPAERIAKLVTDRFEAATGRAMTLTGDVRPILWPELGVNAGAVTIANADWSDAGPMLAAEQLSVGVDMTALFGGEVRIKRVEVVKPRVILEVSADGRGNWDMVGDRGATGGARAETAADVGTVPEFTLDRAEISDGSLVFIDRASGSRTELSNLDATLRLPEFRGAAELDIAAAMNGQRFSVIGQVSEFAAFLGAGAVPVTAKVAVGGNKIDFAGRAGMNPMAAGGRLEAALDDMPALFALIGQRAPDLPRGLGREIQIKGNVTMTDAGAVTLRDGTIRLDHNSLTGAADITMGARTKVVANLAAGALDLSAAIVTDGGGAAAGAGAPSTTGWSREVIDVSGLQAIDAEIALAADSVDLGAAQLGRTRISIALDQGRAVTDIKEIQAYDGTVTGTFIVNSRGGLSTRADIQGKGVRLKPLLVQLADWDRLQTTGDVRVNLLGVGNSVHALMNSWDGDGSIKFGQGELAGLDLVGMLRHLDASYVGAGAKTIFESIGATFTVEDGVVTNADLAFLAPLLTASGKGKVGLGAQTLDYRLVPRLLEGQANGGIQVPVLITGTWSDPKFRLDLESLAKEALEVEVEKVKEKAEEAVIERLNEELGVDIQAREDIDDVLKKALEERARDGLLDLLGGNR